MQVQYLPTESIIGIKIKLSIISVKYLDAIVNLVRGLLIIPTMDEVPTT